MIWSDIPGWTCPVLLALYDEVCAEKRSGVFVEVGVAYGKSLAYLAYNAAIEVQIIGVDSWLVKMGRNTPDVWRRVAGYKDARTACEAMLAAAAPDRYELAQGNSVDVAKALDFECDFVFLDGSHEYDAVAADIRAWLPRVKPGGILAGHDINDNYPGVGRAVRELLPGAEVRPAVDNGWGGCWVHRVPQ